MHTRIAATLARVWGDGEPRQGGRVTYTPGDGLPARVTQAAAILGPGKAEVDRLLGLLRPLDTRRCEILATVYAAWNDLLLAGGQPTDRDIIHDVRNNWHVSKQSIPDHNWFWGIRWLQQNKVVPRGTGRAVGPAASDAGTGR